MFALRPRVNLPRFAVSAAAEGVFARASVVARNAEAVFAPASVVLRDADG